MINIKEFYEKFMNTKRLVIILIIGIALLLLPNFSSSDKKTEEKTSRSPITDIEKYEKSLEKKLSSMLSEVKGAGKVSVMITFSDYGKYVYSQEQQSEHSETVTKGTQKPILKNSSSGGEEPILIKAELPEISGVLVTAEGAHDPTVRENITEAVKAVLDINSKNISVLSRKILKK